MLRVSKPNCLEVPLGFYPLVEVLRDGQMEVPHVLNYSLRRWMVEEMTNPRSNSADQFKFEATIRVRRALREARITFSFPQPFQLVANTLHKDPNNLSHRLLAARSCILTWILSRVAPGVDYSVNCVLAGVDGADKSAMTTPEMTLDAKLEIPSFVVATLNFIHQNNISLSPIVLYQGTISSGRH